ncbi:helix-turn-helix transcriptional regulator [Arenibaculum sp.]|uniref:helix-turn-helix transcriptional regulator n=1 Tax=Arenibaculum sp. TaxID=2865862 RepID=UPI002E10E616|nr:LuxR C-terminal-related transcriptional regulator [Arenibaculum sp.]
MDGRKEIVLNLQFVDGMSPPVSQRQMVSMLSFQLSTLPRTTQDTVEEHAPVVFPLSDCDRLVVIISANMKIEELRRDNEIFTEQPCKLTSREYEISRMVKVGMTNKEIARELNISPSTVKNHIQNILGKLSIDRRTRIQNFV